MAIFEIDLATIHKLLDCEEYTPTPPDPGICPGCNMPFDKGKKRKLIDTCGHERCYSCMFRNEACPLCTSNDQVKPPKKSIGYPDLLQEPVNAHYGEIKKCASTMLPTSGYTRPKVKTNGHFTSLMQARGIQDSECCWRDVSPSRLPKPLRQGDLCSQPSSSTSNVMTQSCPTPPNRRRFFSSRALKGSVWSFKGLSQSSNNNNTISDEMTTSAPVVDTRRWSTVVLGKIKTLWSYSSSSLMAGLNAISTDDEGGATRQTFTPDKKGSQNDLYTRLGLLLGDKAKRSSSSSRSRSCNRSIDSAASVTSLATLDVNNFPSSNTSPVSTLTGSSETDPNRSKKEQSSDSVSSLMSMSSHSNCSSSPLTRRHSVTTSQPGQIEELTLFKNRKSSIRRSARSGTIKGPIDPKIRFAQYRTHQQMVSRQLNLKPLFFEVPLQEPDPMFLGRDWLIREVEELNSFEDNPGILITGLPGTGKTALILQLVEHSCFGRHREPIYKQVDLHTINGKDRPTSSSQYSIYCQTNLVSERLKDLASRVVAYHFCQADNNSTCMVPDFVHSIAAQLCQAPVLSDYKDYLLSESYLQGSLSMKECIADADLAFTRGVLEPLSNIQKLDGLAPGEHVFILIDALCEAEYHRPDYGDTIASFLAKHTPNFPPWLKVIATVRTHLEEVLPALPFSKISLDINSQHVENVQKDLLNYINFRVTNSPSIQSNLVTGAAGQYRFCQHLLGLCRGSFLFAKLTLDLFERGHLVAKSTSFKVLPVTLAQIYQLHFNLRFPTASAFQKVSSILSVCLAALYPLTISEIYYSVNSLNVHTFVPWEEFLQRFKTLSEFLVKRMDNTYMFFHPSFREWLIKREETESNKFLCDLRAGHAAIAFRFSRLEAPLDAEKTLELGHHILKAHIYKNMTLHKYSSRDLQSYWVVSVSRNVSQALCCLRNVYSPNIKVSRLMLLSGASPNHITEYLGQAPILCLFANEGVSEMVALLLEFEADVDLANNQGCTPLIMAAIKGHQDIIEQLIGAGAILGRTDTAGRCALVHAARNGHLNILAYLLTCDWVVDSQQREVELSQATQQALVAAASQGHEEIVEYLLDMSSVDIDEQCPLTGETALTIAAANGCHNVCSLLINKGCRISATNRKDMSALMVAVKEGHWAATERLIQYQAALEQCDNVGRTPLMMAAAEGHVAIIDLLLIKGANITTEDCEGMTALSWACLRGKIQAAQCLLDNGADINHANKIGRTPLDLAAFQGNPGLTQLLMDRGAMIEHADLEGVRPLDRAISCRNIPVVQCFLRKGAKLGPTTWSMAAGKLDIMLVLLNKLLEDGNVLYRKSRLREAAHRYNYALSKFPAYQELDSTFKQLRLNFLLNYSRCKRKMNEPESAVDLATEVLKVRPDSYEAYYARAKARMDLRMYEDALSDIQEALIVLPPQNRDVRRILLKLKDEIKGGTSTASSVDTLNCPTETSL
ncbi:protein TANC2 isoform X3 [Planococcus citri]|uniref:protein TANC2 isoform X3 n=1 Tax=Planococcus citri TaxID=170843 RepID=UPI0031F87B6A